MRRRCCLVLVAVVSIVLGVLALAQVAWFPTGALIFGVLALATGLLVRSRLGDRSGLATVGASLGGIATVGTVILVVVTTGD
jgi:apolipoprotein N-acyltransferase